LTIWSLRNLFDLLREQRQNNPMNSTTRDGLIDDVMRGRLTPDQAEAEARRLGLEPLASEPDKGAFDPMKEADWTLPMAAAWIAYRTPAAVRDWWDKYRQECWVWQFKPWRLGQNGSVVEGHFLEHRPRATLALFQLTKRDEARGSDIALSMAPMDSVDTLWTALRGCCFEATGIDVRTRERVTIPVEQWRDLESFEERGRDIIRSGEAPLSGGVQYRDLTVPMHAVVGLWSSVRKAEPELPRLVRPEDNGHIPLYCAAQWIATGGGERTFDPTDRSIWQPAIDDLLAHAAAGELAVTGTCQGQREPIATHLFIDCQVCYPLENELPFACGEDLYLRLCPYLDDEHWHRGFNDALLHRSEERWSRLMVSRLDVRRIWPFELDDTVPRRPGRPARVDDAFLAEWTRRLDARDLEATLARQADVLIAWYRKHFSHKRAPVRSTVTKQIGRKYREAKLARN
jgi:hypothetical protein